MGEVEREKWSKKLFWLIIADTILNKDKEYPDENWKNRFLQLEAEGEYIDNDNYEDYEDYESKEDKLEYKASI